MTDTTAGRHAASRPMRDPWAGSHDFPEHPRPTLDPQARAVLEDLNAATYPEQAAEPRPRPVEDAFAYTADRLDRLEHLLGSLNGTIVRLADQLNPVLTGGTYGHPDATPGDATTLPTPEDRRSTIARRISGAGDRVDHLADVVARLERELEDLTDALEV